MTSSTEPAAFSDLLVAGSLTSVTAGIFGRVPLGKRLAAQGELNYARLGTNLGSLRVRSGRLQIPIVLQYVLADDQYGLRAFAGPMWGLELACSARLIAEDSEIDGACPFGSNAGGLSLVMGGLVEISMDSSHLILDLRYDHGITRLETPGGQSDYRGYRGFEATIGFGFVPPRS